MAQFRLALIAPVIHGDNGCSYSNEQLSLICGSIGTVLLHTKIRDGASKVTIHGLLEELREEVAIPLVFVTYVNEVFSYGTERFLSACRKAGWMG